MSYLDNIIIKIMELRESDFGVGAIAQELKIPVSLVLHYENHIQKEIERAILKGANSLEQIANRVGISSATIEAFASRYKIYLPPIKTATIRKRKMSADISKEKNIVFIREAAGLGLNADEIGEYTGLSYNTVRRHALKFGIKLPRKRMYRKLGKFRIMPTIDDIVNKAPTLQEMADESGITGEGMRYRLIIEELYPLWVQSKERKKKEIKDARQKIVDILELRIDSLIQNLPWAHQKATQYCISRPGGHPYDALAEFFRRCEQARNSGEMSSLRELCNGLSINADNARRILKILGEESMYRSRDRHTISQEESEAIKRGYDFGMRAPDTAHFIGIKEHIVRQAYLQAYFRTQKKPKFRFLARIDRKKLTYRLASQIYQICDENPNFATDKIAQQVGTISKVVEHAINNRSNYGQQIIQALRVLYNNNDINNPYLQK